MSEKPRAAIALDLDGTTLNSKGELTERTVSTLKRMHSSSHFALIIATGRETFALQPLIDVLALPTEIACIGFNGACTSWMSQGNPPKIIRALSFGKRCTQVVLDICKGMDLVVSYCAAKQSFVVPPQSFENVNLLSEFERLQGVPLERVSCYEKLLEGSGAQLPLKIIALSKSPGADARRARELLAQTSHEEASNLHVIPAECHIEFLSPNGTKGHALSLFCEDIGVRLENVHAFGDNINDIEMLSSVGEGVAMANAKAEVKARASRVSKWSNDENGVARELEAILDSMAKGGYDEETPANKSCAKDTGRCNEEMP
jgi:Cof subfamily protein (haloacid dehalogenase superfamily)